MRRLLDGTLQLLRPVPVTAWQPLFLILFGLGSHTALLLVTLGCFYPILLNTVIGVRSVEPRLLEAASMLGLSPTAMFPKVVLPSAMPGIFTGLRLGLGFAWVVIVVGEISGVRTGLGAMITDAREVSRTDVVIAGMIVIGLAGFASDQIVRVTRPPRVALEPAAGVARDGGPPPHRRRRAHRGRADPARCRRCTSDLPAAPARWRRCVRSICPSRAANSSA